MVLLSSSDINQVSKAGNVYFVKIDTNSVGEIQQDEAALITHLFLTQSNITDLTGLEAFINLRGLYCDENNINTLTPNSTLLELHCAYNNLKLPCNGLELLWDENAKQQLLIKEMTANVTLDSE